MSNAFILPTFALRWLMALRLLSRPGLCVLSLLACLWAPTVLAANTDLPSHAEVQNQLDNLTKQKTLTDHDKLVLQDLTNTQNALDSLDRTRQEAAQLKQQLTQAPEKLRQVQAALDELKEQTPVTPTPAPTPAAPVTAAGTPAASATPGVPVVPPVVSNVPLRQLETRLNQALDDLQSAQEDLSTFNSQLISLQTQPERVQATMYGSSERIQQIRNQLNGLDTGSDELRPSEQQALLAEQAALNAQLDLQRKYLAANTNLQDLLQKQRDYTSAHIDQLEHLIQSLQAEVNDKRLVLSEKTAKAAQTPGDTSDIQNNPLVSKEMATNRDLSQRLITATEESNTLVQQNITIKNWLDRAVQSERNLKEQIAVLKGSLLLSRILYQQQQKLPPGGLVADMATHIADLRLEQYELEQQRDTVYLGDNYIQQLAVDNKVTFSDDVEDALSQIVDMRRELLDQLNKQLGHQLMLAINLQINQQQLVNVNDSLQETLTQQIFWVSSNKPIDWAWLQDLPGAVKEQLSNLNLGIAPAQLVQGLWRSLVFLVPGLFVIILLVWRGKLIEKRIDELSSDIGQLKRDSQSHTPLAILLTLLRLVPGLLLILGIGQWLYRSGVGSTDLVWHIAQQLALCWFIFGLCYRMLSPNGISERHFRVSASLCAHYRRQTLRLACTLVPLIFWSELGASEPLGLVDDVIGQGVISLNLMLLAVLVYPLCRDGWREKSAHAVRLVVVTALFVMPLFLIGLMFAGYFYTSLRLVTRWIDSFYLWCLWNIVASSALRGLSIAARQLAYRRALARRQNQIKEGAEGSEPIEDVPMGLDQINQQSLRLTTMVLFLLFASCFYLIWSDLITVMSYLDSIVLWHSSTAQAGSTLMQAVTLGNVLVALLIVVVSYIMTRNLPGLLEVLVLSRLQLRQGTSYAITTVLAYLITAVGAMAAFGYLGVSWNKLQWLAAALSVGLGFGLQEIFANFVSGLIILFERPVRIGDTITIGTFSGTVSKIRIRATTITDFDRKEVIIPNKAFVTERLINWSLSDTITRVLITLGVAYGSDLDKVKAVLLQAAYENARVMRDPEPQVFFLHFGASTLDHELRLYVRELRDRSHTVDELNRSIERLCRENDISIAFNQLEVTLHSPQGQEIQEVKRTQNVTDADKQRKPGTADPA